MKTLKYSFNSDSVSSVQQRIDIASKTLKELCQVMELYNISIEKFINHTSHNVLVTDDTISIMVEALSKNDSIDEFAFFDETKQVTERKTKAIQRRIGWHSDGDSLSLTTGGGISSGPLGIGRMACGSL